ncbi:MAG TPA: molybdenum cofactor guanylyltransferase [Tepidisphaeraceae bacterium]|jgi:molybdopterin-guanine dinucleotide biosynthesis protein A|nr:molybdenum cofactor guanylyltransferase [Tepidisphaeraceae bacterium]
MIDAPVTLAILAGGEGSRMGTPKGLLRIGPDGGRPILSYLLHRMTWRGPTLLVTAPGRERPPGCEGFDREANDPESGGGPLRGVLTALEHARTAFTVVLTVDMPEIGPEQVRCLLDILRDDPKAIGAMLRRANADGTQIEPFPSAYRSAARQPIAARLKGARRSVHGLLQDPGFLSLDAPAHWPPGLWTNLNSPDDLRAYTRK